MKGWKTIIFNILTGGLLLVEGLGEGWGIDLGTIAAVSSIVNIVLRFITTTPVGRAA